VHSTTVNVARSAFYESQSPSTIIKEYQMTLKAVVLSALSPTKGNPRRRIDKNAIIGLAKSIKTDGVLQNLVVEKSGNGKFTIISGSRRHYVFSNVSVLSTTTTRCP